MSSLSIRKETFRSHDPGQTACVLCFSVDTNDLGELVERIATVVAELEPHLAP